MDKIMIDWEHIGEYMADPIEYRFIDRADVVPGKEAFGTKAVSSQDWYLRMNPEANPAMPAGFLLESLMQTGVLILTTLPESKNPLMMFQGCQNIEIQGRAYPGDLIETHVQLRSYRHGVAKFYGEATSGGGK